MVLTRALVGASSRARLGITVGLVALLLLLLELPGSASAQTPPKPQDDWLSDPSYSISFLGRDSAKGPDRYHAIFGSGATFFGIAVNSMPLLPAEQSVAILMDGYKSAFPGHLPQDIQPDDGFDFLVPVGTIVADKWKNRGHVVEYQSLRGDNLVLYNDFNSLISYRLARTEDPTRAEVVINKDAPLNELELAKAVYGRDDPNFRPDVLQVSRTAKAIKDEQDSIAVDLTKSYLDDFTAIRDQAERGGLAQSGLLIYWFRSDQIAQPLFRVDDGVGQATAPSGLPSLMRVYYYKDGVVRTYQRAEDTVMLSGRQPRNDEWAQVFTQYGKADPAPAKWENGQPEDDAAARELASLGIVVLRYEPKKAPPANMFTQLLDFVMSLMKRKQS